MTLPSKAIPQRDIMSAKPDRIVGNDNRTPLERMADLTRRVVAVPKSEVAKAKRRTKKRQT